MLRVNITAFEVKRQTTFCQRSLLMEGTLRSDDTNGNGNENVRKSKRFYNQNNNPAKQQLTLFVNSFTVFALLCHLISRFTDDVNK